MQRSSNTQQLVILLIGIIGYIALYAFNAFLTHHMIMSHYGAISAAISLLTIIGTVSLIGVDSSSKKYLAKYLFQQDSYRARQFLRWSLTVLLIASVIILVTDAVAIIGIFVIEKVIKVIDQRIYITFFFLLFSPFSAAILLISAYYASIQKNIAATFIESSALNLILVAIACVILLMPFHLFGVKLVFMIYAMAYSLLVAITGIGCYRAYQRRQMVLTTPVSELSVTPLQKTWLHTSIKVALFNMSTVLVIQCDILILYLMSFFVESIKTMHQTALFAVATTISSALWLIVSNSYNTVSPLTSSHFDDPKKCRHLNRVILKATLTAVPLTLAVFFIIVVFGHAFLAHFGTNYVSAYPTLVVLSISPLLFMASGYCSNGLKYTGHENSALKIMSLSMLVFFILCPLLTFYLGMMGTAISDIIVWSCIGIASNIVLQRRTQIRSWGA